MRKPTLLALGLLSLSACQSMTAIPVTSASLLGRWHIERLQERPVVDFSPAQLTFNAKNQLSGNNSCNYFSGSYQLNGQQLHISPAASTMKACVDELMQQEQQVMQLLPLVTKAVIKNGKLLLVDSHDNSLLTLKRN